MGVVGYGILSCYHTSALVFVLILNYSAVLPLLVTSQYLILFGFIFAPQHYSILYWVSQAAVIALPCYDILEFLPFPLVFAMHFRNKNREERRGSESHIQISLAILNRIIQDVRCSLK